MQPVFTPELLDQVRHPRPPWPPRTTAQATTARASTAQATTAQSTTAGPTAQSTRAEHGRARALRRRGGVPGPVRLTARRRLRRDGRPGSPDRPPAATAAPETATSGTPNWRIEVRDNVRLSVQDHGVGIPARDLDRIFERFYRVDHGRSRDTGGTGLGLSIVRHVANNHQGWVDVESREGEGSTFSLVLPVQGERVA